MKLKDKKIAFGFTSSFYMFKSTISEIKKLVKNEANIIPIMSENAYSIDTKYGKACEIVSSLEGITGNNVIHTMWEAEGIEADILVIAPCSRK